MEPRGYVRKGSFSVKEVAAQLGCSQRHTVELIRRGLLRAFEIGLGGKRRTIRVRAEVLDEFITAREHTLTASSSIEDECG